MKYSRRTAGAWSSAWTAAHALPCDPAVRCASSTTTKSQTVLDAVPAGLTLNWSSGSIEGAVNRIKRIKRQLYGRAGFELLRKMILLQ